MNYIGIDIGSTASKVAVKEIMIYILYCRPDGAAKKPARRSRIVYWKMASMCYRTIRKLSQPDMAVLP